jgi:hypothetical protein
MNDGKADGGHFSRSVLPVFSLTQNTSKKSNMTASSTK